MNRVAGFVPSIIAAHQSLNGMIAEAMSCLDLLRVLDVLERFRPVLLEHIMEEEAPTGPLETLRGTPILVSSVERIRREHTEFIEAIDWMQERARGALSDDLCGDHCIEEILDIRHHLMRLLDHLLDHEHFETVLYISGANSLSRPAPASMAEPLINTSKGEFKWGPECLPDEPAASPRSGCMAESACGAPGGRQGAPSMTWNGRVTRG